MIDFLFLLQVTSIILTGAVLLGLFLGAVVNFFNPFSWIFIAYMDWWEELGDRLSDKLKKWMGYV